MKEINATQLRQSVRKVARQLERDGAAVLLKIGRNPVGVIIPLRAYEERFAPAIAEEKRRRVIAEIRANRAKPSTAVQEIFDELRGR
jgi:PHD/YefM family antitoxin component YafN of YafNO toxin-antitoxin module